jgi:hypothetical protein
MFARSMVTGAETRCRLLCISDPFISILHFGCFLPWISTPHTTTPSSPSPRSPISHLSLFSAPLSGVCQWAVCTVMRLPRKGVQGKERITIALWHTHTRCVERITRITDVARYQQKKGLPFLRAPRSFHAHGRCANDQQSERERERKDNTAETTLLPNTRTCREKESTRAHNSSRHPTEPVQQVLYCYSVEGRAPTARKSDGDRRLLRSAVAVAYSNLVQALALQPSIHFIPASHNVRSPSLSNGEGCGGCESYARP